MAGASAGEDGSPNPFSFKSFLRRGEGGASSAGTDLRKGERKCTKTGASKKKTASKRTPTGDLHYLEGTKKSSDDNPFLFTKFVERKSSKVSSRTTQLTSSSGDEEDNSLTVVNQFPPAPSLPLNQHGNPASRSPKTKPPPRPSTALQRNKKQKNTKPKKEFVKGQDIFDLSDAGDSDTNVPPPTRATPSVPIATVPTRQLILTRKRSSGSSSGSSCPRSPKGLSILNGRGGVVLDGVANLAEFPFGNAAELKQLQAENESLRRDLNWTVEALEKERERYLNTHKNVSLKNDVKALKKKEAEDMQALEDMVQKVERNLVSTTKRAVAAEATIKHLKQEVAAAQFQLSQNSPRAVHQHYEKLLRGVREKSDYASKQLLTASQMADRNIRELVSGVEALKNVADVLHYIDNISEVRTTEEDKTTA